LVIVFIDNLQIVTTSNYSAIADSNILQFTTARIESSQVCRICIGCRLVTASNAVASSASVLTTLLAGDYLATHSQAGGHLAPTSNSSD
jgi:hypothetical protein